MAIIEVCTANIQSVYAAQKGGAHRIELCSALDAGGVTPSPGLIRAAIAATTIPVCVLIRPREGNFVFSQPEIDLMAHDIAFCRDHGAAGVVIGALTDTKTLDIAALETLRKAAGTMELVFHRAFDFVQNTTEALEILIDMGFCRILSSGQANTAWDGREKLAELVAQSQERITIMPGSGIHLGNIQHLHQAIGATAYHLSAKQWVEQYTEHAIPGLETGFFASDERMIRAVVELAR